MSSPITWPPDVAHDCPVNGDVTYWLSDPTQDAVNNLFLSLAAHVREVHNDEPTALALEAVVLHTDYTWATIP